MPYIKPQGTPPANQNQVNIRQPEAFDFTKPETWPTWEKRFLRFISVANLSRKTSKEKIDLLCYTMGEQSEAILLRIFPNAETKTFDEVLKAFNDYFTPKRNIILERFNFNSRVQLSGESVETFITDLYSLAEKCDYSTSKEDLIRDRIVIGIRDGKTSLRLQLKSDLTLATAIAEVKLAESQEQESQLLRHSKGQEAHKMKKYTQTKALKGSESDTKNCHQCGLPSHLQGELCQAKNSRCRRCSQFGHWDRVCRSKDSLFREKACSSSQNNQDDGFRMSSKFHSSEQSSSNATLMNHINISLAKNGLQAITSSSEKVF